MLSIRTLPFLIFRLLLLITLAFALVSESYAQCTPTQRKYANRQESYTQGLLGTILPGTVSSDANAVDGNPKTFSSLSVPVGLLNLSQATQYLQFTSGTTYIAANTPVTVKIALPNSILGVLDNVILQPFNNLNYFTLGGRWRADAVGTAYTGANLVNLINGAGEFEITVTPTQQFQGIWVNVGSVVGLGVTAKVYDAYILENNPSVTTCNNVVDVLSGVKPSVVGGVLDATTSVTNPYDAVDTDPTGTYSELNAGVDLLGLVYHTTIFKTQATPGDAVSMIVEKPGGGLLNLGLLSGFSIQLYNGSTAVGSPITSSSTGLLALNLLPGQPTTDTKRQLLISVPISYGAYDRVQVKIGGVATAGLDPGLRIYDVKRIIKPTMVIDGTVADSKTICLNTSTTLSIQESQACTSYKWYNVSSGGTSLASGTTYTPPLVALTAGVHTYYIEATRTNCTETSGRIPVTITVDPLPTITLDTHPISCIGTLTANLPFSATTENPTTYSITWSTAGLANVLNATFPSTSPIVIDVPPGTPAATYSGVLTVKNNNGCTSIPINFDLTVHPKPALPHVNISTN